jgi:hypothetical protein
VEKEHIPAYLVKSYLLGEIDHDRAAKLEQEYFTKPAFLAQMKTVEDALIGEYLDGRLRGSWRLSFEQRYLRVPELLERLDAVRNARQANSRQRSGEKFSYLGAAALLIVACGALVWRQLHISPQQPPSSIVQFAPPMAVFSIHLTPGVQKGVGGMVEFSIPAAATKVMLLLELPGRTQPVDAVVRLSAIGADGRRNPVWHSDGATRSEPALGGQSLNVGLKSGLLLPGDYILEAESSRGDILETYVFRVDAHA